MAAKIPKHSEWETFLEVTLHSIEGRSRTNDIEPAKFDHFRLDTGQPVAGRIAVEEPGWTIYCLDCQGRRALFVNIAPEIDLSDAVFVGLKQYREARRALVVPFEALDGLANKLETPRRLVFVFSIGRCGTTLVNAMLNEVDGVWSLSEPEVYFEMAMKRGKLDRDELQGLARSCTRLLFRPPAGRHPHTMAVKFRSQSLFQADLFYTAFPDAAYVFMYRDGASWARSFYYFMRNLGVAPVLDRDRRHFVWRLMSAAADVGYLKDVVDMDAEEVYPEQLLAPAWALHIEQYLGLFESGVPFLAVRYNELNGDREAVVARLLKHCGLPASALPAALAPFARDSQEGTLIARDRREASFTAASQARFQATLAKHPRIKSPELRLPDVYHTERRV